MTKNSIFRKNVSHLFVTVYQCFLACGESVPTFYFQIHGWLTYQPHCQYMIVVLNRLMEYGNFVDAVDRVQICSQLQQRLDYLYSSHSSMHSRCYVDAQLAVVVVFVQEVLVWLRDKISNPIQQFQRSGIGSFVKYSES